MITRLTKKQEKLIPVYQKKWHDAFFAAEFDEDKAKEFVDWLYSLLDKEKPIKIILDSPLSVQLAANILSKKRNLPLASQLSSQLNSQLASQIDSQLDSQLNSQLASQLYSQLRSQLDSQLNSQLDSQLDSQIKSQENLRFYAFDFWGDTSWYGFLCFYDYINEVLFPDVKIPIFDKYKELSLSKINFLLTFDKIAFVSRPPTFTNYDENDRLHCTSDYAVCYADGYGLHFIHGVYFDKETFTKAFINKTMTSEEILAIENAEQKAVLIQEFGFEKIFSDLREKKLIDSQNKPFNRNNGQMVNYALYDVNIDKNITARVLKVEWYEKGRKRQTILGVPRNINDAIEAVAWTCYTDKRSWEEHLLKEA